LIAFNIRVTGQAAPPLTSMDRQRGLAMLRQFRDDIQKHYYDANFKGIDIPARFAQAEETMKKATSLNEVFAIITDAASALDDSHTYFVPPGRNADVLYGWRMAAIGCDAYVVWVDPSSDAAKKGLERGDRVLALNRFQPTRANLSEISYLYRIVRPQLMQRVIVRKPDGTEKTLDIESKIVPRRNLSVVDLMNEFDAATSGAHETQIVEPGVFIWRMLTFGDEDAVAAVAKRARSAKAVVLDLRGNGGGLVSTLEKLAGLFFDREVVIAIAKERKKENRYKGKPQKNGITAPLVVLVDSESGSASELFARLVQIEKRGVIVGDRTAGAVMTGRVQSHATGLDSMVFYGTSVTVADIRMSDGGSLEKLGVTPDEVVLPTAADLAAKRDPALARAIAIAGGSMTPEHAGALFRAR
jgi:carboxyl-terminal processing protease